MSDHEFLFALELSDEARYGEMLNEVAAAVLGYAGCPNGAMDATTASLRKALSAAAADGHSRCDVRFTAHAGELLIIVACAGRPEWRTTLTLPQ